MLCQKNGNGHHSLVIKHSLEVRHSLWTFAESISGCLLIEYTPDPAYVQHCWVKKRHLHYNGINVAQNEGLMFGWDCLSHGEPVTGMPSNGREGIWHRKPAGESTPNCIVLTYLLVPTHPWHVSGSHSPREEDHHTQHKDWWAAAHSWTCHKANGWNTSLCMQCQTERSESFTRFMRSSNRHAYTHSSRCYWAELWWKRKKSWETICFYDTRTQYQIYDTQIDDWYFLSLKFKSQSSLGLLHNSIQLPCTLSKAIHFGGLCNTYSNEA